MIEENEKNGKIVGTIYQMSCQILYLIHQTSSS